MVAGLAQAIERKDVGVAGGGFVPQSLIDSSELIDSTMVRNAEKGHKGNFFIQFSFSSSLLVIPIGIPSTRSESPPRRLRSANHSVAYELTSSRDGS
jgi:hypothetical protein